MPSRTLNVTREAYELLKSWKGPGESFTGVILRLAGERSLFEIVGSLDEEQGRRMEERVSSGRERSRRRKGRQLRIPGVGGTREE